ncbi:MAG: hypothetical protein E6I94_08635 [Chloroflexi bacterium]|nr:MAG: hypothetical protein E6I94_08635 [Chloroflexota bacterium]
MTELDLSADTRVIDPAAPQYNARIIRRVDETESLAYVWVRFDGEAVPFEPGQYMTIGVFADGKLVQRPYSVASSPRVAAEGYEFYVRLVQGGLFTPLLWRLPVGHGMRMIGPKGRFLLEEGDERVHLFISSGTGNAPFVSMIRTLMRAATHRLPQRRVVCRRPGLPVDRRGLGVERRVPRPIRADDLAAARRAQCRLARPHRPRRGSAR